MNYFIQYYWFSFSDNTLFIRIYSDSGAVVVSVVDFYALSGFHAENRMNRGHKNSARPETEDKYICIFRKFHAGAVHSEMFQSLAHSERKTAEYSHKRPVTLHIQGYFLNRQRFSEVCKGIVYGNHLTAVEAHRTQTVSHA